MEASPISQHETERKAQELLHEFYGCYFTGEAVMLAGAEAILPRCDYFYAQQEVPKASEKPQIHTVFTGWKQSGTFTGDVKLVRAGVTAQVIVRAGQPGSGGANPDHVARRVADAVRQIFESEKILLAQKGIRHCKVDRGPVALQMLGMSARLLVISFQLQYQAVA